MSRIVIVADAHLSRSAAAAEELARYLELACQGAQGLYLLGDIFHYAVGLAPFSSDGEVVLFSCLERLAASGVDVVYVGGNREIYLDGLLSGRRGIVHTEGSIDVDPFGLAVHLIHGDTLNRASWYDGKTLTVLDKARNVYMSVDVPGNVDAALDRIADDYGVVIPLSDLLYPDPYATLMEGVAYGEYQGLHHAAGTLCHHLAFSQDAIDWQIWIDAGEKPLPRKLVITYVDEPGAPQYSAVIKRFTLDPKFPEGLFDFVAPEGAQRISESEARRRKEESR